MLVEMFQLLLNFLEGAHSFLDLFAIAIKLSGSEQRFHLAEPGFGGSNIRFQVFYLPIRESPFPLGLRDHGVL
jgi:hypothetical protein